MTAAAELPMQRNEQGWFEVVTDALEPGESYTYRLPDGLEVRALGKSQQGRQGSAKAIHR